MCLSLVALLPGGLFAGMGEPEGEQPPDEPEEGESSRQPTPTSATAAEEITVTATGIEARLSESPTSVTTLTAEELAESAALTVDDMLRRVPGFTLFRRSGSRAANPTTQGASLRGIGGSAASRVLVLADGVPLNDPFGGWVYWNRVPRAALERVEIVRGGVSDLYGSSALVGVAQLLRRPPSREGAVEAEASAGELDTGAFSAWASGTRGAWQASVAGDVLATEGYVPVAAADRGAVDAAAGVEHIAVEGTVGWQPPDGNDRSRFFARISHFEEDRTNGTRVQENDTRIDEVVLGADRRLDGGELTLRLWGSEQRLHQVFSAVADDRESERMVREQEVPSETVGLSGRWMRRIDRADRGHVLLGGLELRRIEGLSDESIFLPSRTLAVTSGGEQWLGGLFVQDLVEIGPRLSAQLAVRYDRWWNRDGRRVASGATTRFPARDEDSWSPRLALRYRASPAWAIVGSAYRSFRAPTLNELYRGFRVGDVVTDPNEGLRAERLTGAEVGAVWTPPGWRLRGTLFWLELEDGISNVTVEVRPDVILRQRQNVGLGRSRGVELEATGRLRPRLGLTIGYLWNDSEVVSFSAEPALEGLRMPQVPEHQASLDVTWLAPFEVRAALQARWAGDAFDDDRNLFPLGDMMVVDLRLGRDVTERFEAFVAAENLLNDEYAVGRTPMVTVGAPRQLRVGLRFRS